jgi:hypothetical protein
LLISSCQGIKVDGSHTTNTYKHHLKNIPSLNFSPWSLQEVSFSTGTQMAPACHCCQRLGGIMMSVAREGSSCLAAALLEGRSWHLRWSINARVMVVLPYPMPSAKIPPRTPKMSWQQKSCLSNRDRDQNG